MIEKPAAPLAGATRHVAGNALLLVPLLLSSALLAGCSQNTGPAGSRLRIYAADVIGSARVCQVPNVDPVAGQNTEAAIKMDNDGGWCALRVRQDGARPYGAGLLITRPAHGSVLVHTVGDDTRIDFTPDRGFTGTDSFTVKLVPGDANVEVAVTVTAAST
jgi:hypothetical protein